MSYDSDDDIDNKLINRSKAAQSNVASNDSLAPISVNELSAGELARRAREARRRRTDARIGDDDDDIVETSGLRAASMNQNDAGEDVVTRVQGEEAGDGDDDVNYIVDGEAVEIEPFNLDREREKGHFDESGHYIEKSFGSSDKPRKRMKFNANDSESDEDRVTDPWLDEMEQWKKQTGSKGFADIQRAHAAQEKRFADAAFVEPINAKSVIEQLKKHLNDEDETVRSAMSRLRPPPRTATKRARKQQKSNDDNNAATTDNDAATSAEKRAQFDTFLDLVNQATAAGCSNVYDSTADELDEWLVEQQRAEAKQRATDNGLPELVWHYRLSISDPNIHGPFTTDQMREWYKAGYFSSEDVLVRARAREDTRTGFRPANLINWKRLLGLSDDEM